MQAAPAAAANPYGLIPALQQGGIIALSVFTILVLMSVFSFYILFTKLMQQQKIISPGPQGPGELLELAKPARSIDQARGEERLSRDRRRCPAGPGPARQADRPDRPA